MPSRNRAREHGIDIVKMLAVAATVVGLLGGAERIGLGACAPYQSKAQARIDHTAIADAMDSSHEKIYEELKEQREKIHETQLQILRELRSRHP